MDHEELTDEQVQAMFERPSWEERYGTPDRVWSGKPNPQLVAEAEHLPPGTALDIGCGEGADVMWLAELGWTVTGLDFSQSGLDKAAAVARDAGLADRTRFEQGDIRTWQPAESYDLISSQFMHLLDGGMRELVPRLADALKPGGLLLVVGHHPDDLRTGLRHASRPGVMFTPDDLVPTVDPDRFGVSGEVREREHLKDGAPVTVRDSVVTVRAR
ncbi:SAM-dependent methyltransferase [Aeromicrobium sp. CF3.5]|uniref:SAM-dependent methyltransferase n=1 Tax=Aeromicrobium sp. CF3.5 TaxID=3373078 RepID=UPI003EE5283E